MPNLVIRFIHEPDLVSKLIAWETDSLFVHCEGLSWDEKSWIGAHAGTGVQARPLDWCKPTFERRYALPVESPQWDRAMAWLETRVGEPYDYADIVGLALHSRKGASDHEIICSALMIEWMWQAGLEPLNCREGWAYLITPESLHLSPLFIGKGI